MSSIWLDRKRATYPPLGSERDFEVVVAGGGIVGLTTALLLARGGVRVAVVESRHIAAGTTGHSTAKVSLLQGTKLSAIRARHSLERTQAYVQANQQGQAWLAHYCAENGIEFQRRTAYTYAATEAGQDALRAEFGAATEAGLPVQWQHHTELPFPVAEAISLPDQGQTNPVVPVDAGAGL